MITKPLPPAFTANGFVTPDQARHQGRTRGLMIASEGESDTGKTEFILTCPGPGLIMALDRGFDALCDNPTPPMTRRTDFGLKVIKAPAATQFSSAKDYQPYWQEFLKTFIGACSMSEARTVAVDGDNFGWDLQRLAEHGRLTGIFPQTRYTDVYAARRALYFRAWDTGKIIITTNMVRDEFRYVVDDKGAPVLDDAGEQKKERTGEKVSLGFPDKTYLWQIRIRHLYEPPKFNKVLKRMVGGKWGIKITKCKANPTLVGETLWGADCTFTGLVSYVYPHIALAEWGL